LGALPAGRSDEARRISWVLAGLTLAALPHVAAVPFWILLLTASAAAWRLAAARRGWELPPRWLRVIIALVSVGAIALEFRTLNGLEAGTALLTLMAGVKLLETRALRDLTVLIFIAYFILFAAFLYEQSLPWLPYMLVTTWLLTATLLRIHESGQLMGAREALALAGRMLLTALPLAALLFVSFPRLPGQFWALPARTGSKSGLTDEMSPGDVSALSLDDTIAFRAEFKGHPPPPRERYWRGPVLHDFDGRAWRRLRGRFLRVDPPEPIGAAYVYRIMLEPHGRNWLVALDMARRWPKSQAMRSYDYQLVTHEPVTSLRSFDLISFTRYRAGRELSTALRRIDTALPEGPNPRAVALAHELRAAHPDDQELIAAVLDMFRDQEFYYSLEPPGLGANAVDQFLFSTRIGFCEHYASAFAVLMRAAGIPARVVTGYQGGQVNPYSGYLVVRQSDAHAWSEVWLDGRGWVRVDPTAAVAPSRIESGLDAALPEGEPVPGRFLARSDLLTNAVFVWDALNTFWNDQIVEFDADTQASLLEQLGFDKPGWQLLGIAMMAGLAAFFVGMTLYLGWSYRPRAADPAAQVFAQICRRFAHAALPLKAGEGPVDYLRRLAVARPDLAADLDELRKLYVGLRYGPDTTPGQLSRLRYVASRLRV
jgi:protein-glutamine gamma-glutamyltransferase